MEVPEYPSNLTPNQKRKEKPKIEKIIDGKALERKKPLGHKIAETFGGDDLKSVANYVLIEVAVPAAKNMISDMVSQGIERLLFGEVRPRSSSRSKTYTSYSSLYSGDQRNRRAVSTRSRATHRFDDIILPSREEAETVLDSLDGLIEQYDVATLSDLYQLVGITPKYTDDKFGWTDIHTASAKRTRDGFALNLPKPISLED